MYQAIVVGTDGSETANIAVGRATELAKLTGATLHIVHVFQPLTRTHLGASATVASPTIDIVQVNEGIEGHAHDVLDHAAAAAKRADVKVEVHALPGDPADTLVAAAKNVGADLVVVGSRGMSGVKRFVLGSVPNKVSHHCPCSLLIVDTDDRRVAQPGDQFGSRPARPMVRSRSGASSGTVTTGPKIPPRSARRVKRTARRTRAPPRATVRRRRTAVDSRVRRPTRGRRARRARRRPRSRRGGRSRRRGSCRSTPRVRARPRRGRRGRAGCVIASRRRAGTRHRSRHPEPRWRCPWSRRPRTPWRTHRRGRRGRRASSRGTASARRADRRRWCG